MSCEARFVCWRLRTVPKHPWTGRHLRRSPGKQLQRAGRHLMQSRLTCVHSFGEFWANSANASSNSTNFERFGTNFERFGPVLGRHRQISGGLERGEVVWSQVACLLANGWVVKRAAQEGSSRRCPSSRRLFGGPHGDLSVSDVWPPFSSRLPHTPETITCCSDLSISRVRPNRA